MSQPFSAVNPNVQDLMDGVSKWGDFDQDGDYDLLITGERGPDKLHARIYGNVGGNFGLFKSLSGIRLGGAGGWGDYDRDGFIDLLYTGDGAENANPPAHGNPVTKLMRNINGNDFQEVSTGITDVRMSGFEWGDYDNDGDLDVLITGATSSSKPVSQVITNTQRRFSLAQNLTPVLRGSIAWGDYDRDGDLDILLTGEQGLGGTATTEIWRNNGGSFQKIATSMPALTGSDAVWGDYTGDGYLDIFLMGNQGPTVYTEMWVYNPAAQNFTKDWNQTNLPLLTSGHAAWADYDGDGDLDIAIIGRDKEDFCDGVRQGYIYYQDFTGKFWNSGHNIDDLAEGTVSWGDYDGDNNLDLMVQGYKGCSFGNNSWTTQLYRNDRISSNIKPSSPNNLASNISGGNVSLSWSPAIDNTTPQSALTYNLYLRDQSGKLWVSPHANIATGFRGIAKAGQITGTSWTIKGLPTGTYFWSVQAVDAGLLGSAFSAEASFSVGAPQLADLVPRTVTVTPNQNLMAGQSIQTDAIIDNIGAGASVQARANIFLSPDVIWGNGNDTQIGSDAIEPLQANTFTSKLEVVTIPAGTPPGQWYILYVVDANQEVNESNENNNVAAIPISLATAVDLSLENPSVTPNTVVAGDAIQVQIDVRNVGQTVSGLSELGIYLSEKNTLDATASLLDARLVSDLGPGLGSTISASISIDVSTPPNAYFLLFFADHLNANAESNETNNILNLPLTITAPFAWKPTPTSGRFLGQVQQNGINASVDDWIAAIDTNGVVAGATRVQQANGVSFFNLSIYGDDPNTAFDDGLIPGESFKLMLFVNECMESFDYPFQDSPTWFGSWSNQNGGPIPAYSDANQIFNFIFNKTSIQSDLLTYFQAYPNPFDKQIAIRYQLRLPSEVKLKLYNLHGALLHSQTSSMTQLAAQEQEAVLSTEGLSKGVYLLRMELDGQTAVVHRLVKQ